MTFDFFTEFQRINSERQNEWGKGQEIPPLFHATQLGGEVGEALNEVKKLEREKMGWKGSRTTVEKLGDELADVVICAENLAAAYGIDLKQAMVRKFNATSDEVGYRHKISISPGIAATPKEYLQSELIKVRTENQKLRSLFKRILPFSDTMICYGSTLEEHEGNRVYKAVQDLKASIKDF